MIFFFFPQWGAWCGNLWRAFKGRETVEFKLFAAYAQKHLSLQFFTCKCTQSPKAPHTPVVSHSMTFPCVCVCLCCLKGRFPADDKWSVMWLERMFYNNPLSKAAVQKAQLIKISSFFSRRPEWIVVQICEDIFLCKNDIHGIIDSLTDGENRTSPVMIDGMMVSSFFGWYATLFYRLTEVDQTHPHRLTTLEILNGGFSFSFFFHKKKQPWMDIFCVHDLKTGKNKKHEYFL